MDVGMTKSGHNSLMHYITGSIVFFGGYALTLFAMRDWLLSVF